MVSTEDDITRRTQVRASLAQLLDEARLAAVTGPVRDQFAADLTALTDAEQDSKELKSAKRHLLFDRIVEGVELPFPVAPVPAEGEPPTVKDTITKQYVKKAAEATYKELVRHKIAVDGRRPDGRSNEEIRNVSCEVGVSPGRTAQRSSRAGRRRSCRCSRSAPPRKASGSTTCRSRRSAGTCTTTTSRPTRSGETGFMRGPKRRDIGHGALAQRALEPVLPGTEDFPYTIRIVSETLESNGSSSMGSVCGSTLSLQDAGVPIKAPVSGISIGLIKEGDDYTILTDIQGAEDHLGDMDFKVAGTREGITALQMDCKISGVTQEIMRSALEQAKRAREAILDTMAEVMPESRAELAEHAPRISTLKINPEYIGMVIGKGGETIRSLESDYDVQIDIEEDGTILVYATEGTKATAAMEAITNLTKDPEVGDTFVERKVVKTTQFGAFVELKKGTDGLLHVSNVGPGEGRPHRGRHQPRRRARRDRAGGRQGARPDRPQAHREARERHARPARGAHRAGEERARASARGALRPRPPRRAAATAARAATRTLYAGAGEARPGYHRRVARRRLVRLVVVPPVPLPRRVGNRLHARAAGARGAGNAKAAAGSVELGDPYRGRSVSETSAGCHGPSAKAAWAQSSAGNPITLAAQAQIENGGGTMPAQLVAGRPQADVLAYLATILATG